MQVVQVVHEGDDPCAFVSKCQTLVTHSPSLNPCMLVKDIVLPLAQ
jgi:hypothetical protein